MLCLPPIGHAVGVGVPTGWTSCGTCPSDKRELARHGRGSGNAAGRLSVILHVADDSRIDRVAVPPPVSNVVDNLIVDAAAAPVVVMGGVAKGEAAWSVIGSGDPSLTLNIPHPVSVPSRTALWLESIRLSV